MAKSEKNYTNSFQIIENKKYPNHSIKIERWIAEDGGYANLKHCTVRLVDYSPKSWQIEIVSNNPNVPNESHFVAKSKSVIIKSVTEGKTVSLGAF
jgi:hypothetical protein